jgi:hypothetical protein
MRLDSSLHVWTEQGYSPWRREPDLRGLNPVSCAPPKQLVTGQASSQRELHVPTWEYAPSLFPLLGQSEVSQNWTVKFGACLYCVTPSWLQNSPIMKLSYGLFSHAPRHVKVKGKVNLSSCLTIESRNWQMELQADKDIKM